MSRLDVSTTQAATNLGLKFRDCYYLVLSSYYHGEIARFGPGRAHLHNNCRHVDGFGAAGYARLHAVVSGGLDIGICIGEGFMACARNGRECAA